MKEKVYCPIRKIDLIALPEEKVRQQLITLMVQTLGFPLSHLAVEKSLRQMPHFNQNLKKIPNRRADLLCYAKDIHPSHSLYPLLLVECKAIPIGESVIRQAMNYNQFLRAYFITVANKKEIQTGWYHPEKQKYIFIQGLPSYQHLLDLKRVIPTHNTRMMM